MNELLRELMGWVLSGAFLPSVVILIIEFVKFKVRKPTDEEILEWVNKG